MSGLFQNCPFANPNERSIGGRCCPNPGPMPGSPGSCAHAQPPAINNPAPAKTSRTIFNVFIDLSLPCVPRDPFPPSCVLLLSCFVGLLIRVVVNHHLRQRLHGRRNLSRYIAVYRCQQILILTSYP